MRGTSIQGYNVHILVNWFSIRNFINIVQKTVWCWVLFNCSIHVNGNIDWMKFHWPHVIDLVLKRA